MAETHLDQPLVHQTEVKELPTTGKILFIASPQNPTLNKPETYGT